jgi:hypothetical protein
MLAMTSAVRSQSQDLTSFAETSESRTRQAFGDLLVQGMPSHFSTHFGYREAKLKENGKKERSIIKPL